MFLSPRSQALWDRIAALVRCTSLEERRATTDFGRRWRSGMERLAPFVSDAQRSHLRQWTWRANGDVARQEEAEAAAHVQSALMVEGGQRSTDRRNSNANVTCA
jgi:hypothetical protein